MMRKPNKAALPNSLPLKITASLHLKKTPKLFAVDEGGFLHVVKWKRGGVTFNTVYQQ